MERQWLQVEPVELANLGDLVDRDGNLLTVAHREHYFRRTSLDDLMHDERRQIIEQMHIVDTHHHRGSGGSGSQRLDHPPDQLDGVSDTGLRPRGERTQWDRPGRRRADRPPAFASLRPGDRQSLANDPAFAHTCRPADNDPGSIRGQDGGLDGSHLFGAADQRPRQAHPESL